MKLFFLFNNKTPLKAKIVYVPENVGIYIKIIVAVLVVCLLAIPKLSAQTKIYVGTNGYSMTTAVALADTDSSSVNSLINPLNETAAAQASADYVDEAAEVPSLLKGIWYNTNRYIIFDHGFSSEL